MLYVASKNSTAMNGKFQWLDLARQLQSIAQAGLSYSKDIYDLERFEQVKTLAKSVINEYSGMEMERISKILDQEDGYLTPKVDVRGVVFRNDRILMVKETIDGCWSLPGGWADVGLTASEVVVKEVFEESGLEVRAGRLLAVLDKKCHPHPPDLYYVYKLFFLCEEMGGSLQKGMESSEVKFFPRNRLPELSVGRNTVNQVDMMFELKNNPGEVVFD
jgi:ADP-ribose pyrophosphatase YjhB (NUDIX family)